MYTSSYYFSIPLLFIFFSIFIFLATFNSYAKNNIQSIAFTSCIWQPDPSIWKEISDSVINNFKPDIFIFAGDSVYNDMSDNGVYLTLDYAYQRVPFINYTKWFYRQNVMDSLSDKFKAFTSTDFFVRLSSDLKIKSESYELPSNIGGYPGILAIWDDHDYGYNDAGSWHPEKIKAKNIFQSYFGKPPNSDMLDDQAGIYGSYLCGPSNNLQIILLDCRSFKTPHFKLQNNPNPTILGDTQWDWLNKELNKSVSIRIIVSSIPVLAKDIFAWKNGKWKTKSKERWDIFGKERQRLLNLLSKSTGQVIILSGDWHFADISKITQQGKQIYEVTAGGWHSNDPNFKGYKGLRSRFKQQFSLESIQKDHPPTAWQNFGGIRINWDTQTIHLATYNKDSDIPDGYETTLSFYE